ncbi:MAG: hypothetical protein P4N60_10850 [Verrucomicrobiae bacterium]|nr:hypothetical protein [Verrucomicrobiae bacterium]
MNDENEDVNPVNEMLTELEEAALGPDLPADADSPRDVWWLRWLKFISIIALPAIVLGLGFLFEYGAELKHRDMDSSKRIMPSGPAEQDVHGEMKFRFWLGASVGGSLGLIYVAKCVIRKTDP